MTDADMSEELEFIVDSLVKRFPHTVTGVMTGDFGAYIFMAEEGSYIVIDYNRSKLDTKNYLEELYWVINNRRCDTG